MSSFRSNGTFVPQNHPAAVTPGDTLGKALASVSTLYLFLDLNSLLTRIVLTQGWLVKIK